MIASVAELLYELKPDCEAESGPLNNIDNTQEFSPLKCGEAYPSGTETQQVETSIRLGQTLMMHASHAGGKFLLLYLYHYLIRKNIQNLT